MKKKLSISQVKEQNKKYFLKNVKEKDFVQIKKVRNGEYYLYHIKKNPKESFLNFEFKYNLLNLKENGKIAYSGHGISDNKKAVLEYIKLDR